MFKNYPFSLSIICLIFFSILFYAGCKEPEPVEPPPLPPPSDPCEFPEDYTSYELVWEQEFEAAELDTNMWNYQLGNGCDVNLCGWGNEELEVYTNEEENIFLKDGILTIQAVEVSPQNYTSARINTKGKAFWRFGRFDIRAKLPTGQGLWPAIWMLPEEEKYGTWPQSGEIDIMEIIGNQPNETHGTVHYGPIAPNNKSKTAAYRLPSGDFSDDFHIFTLEWQANCMRWLVDGEPFGLPISSASLLPESYPFNDKFHLLLNVAVGGRWPGDPDSTTVFPQSMEVDYIKVYEKK